MSWFYLALLSAIGLAAANIFRRIVMREDKSDALVSAITFQFIGAAIVGIFAYVHGFMPLPIAKYPINFILQAIFWGSATLSLFKAARYLDASESAIITNFTPVLTIITAIIFLHEHLTPLNVIGALLIIVAVLGLSYEKGKVRLNKGTLYALGYCLFAAFGSVNDGYMFRYTHSDTLSLLTLGFLAPGIFLFLTRPTIITKFESIFKIKEFSKVFALTFFYAIGTILYVFALATGGQVSQAFTINQSSIIVTMLIGVIFLHERGDLLKKFLCAVLVTAGVILLS